jgi:thymidine kinase
MLIDDIMLYWVDTDVMNSTGQDKNQVNNHVGIVRTFIGPMYSEKTTSMSSAVERYAIAQKRCVVIKYTKDTRYSHLASSGGIVTHRGNEYAKVPVVSTELLADVDHLMSNYDIIGIDEAQFYADGPEFIQKWAMAGRGVVCACLDGTFQAKPFNRVAEIIALSDKVTKLNAVCMQCSNDAAFTKRIVPGDEVEVIGGMKEYIAVCRKCMFSETN